MTLYAFGYLSLRFHLMALGIATDLSVLDERYLFTGARFLVYVLCTLPNIMLLALPIGAATWASVRLFSGARRARIATWLLDAPRLSWAAIVLSVAVIQLLMRQCFQFSNLLFDPRAPGEIVVLTSDRQWPLASLGMSDASTTPWDLDQNALEGQRELSHIRSQRRLRGTTVVDVLAQTRDGLSTKIEWTDVVVQQSGAEPRNLSNCDGDACTQPALSPDA